MLKKEITYENFDGETVTETHYFHLAKTDLFEMDVEHKDGLEAWLSHLAEAEDRKAMYTEFKNLILRAYGQRSEDGKRFIKSAELSEEFSQTGAYEALFMELVSDDKAAIDFIASALPKDVAEAARANMEESMKAEAADKAEATKDISTVETPAPEVTSAES